MSGFEKPNDSYVYADYDATTRPGPEASFAASYTQPTFGPQFPGSQPADAHALPATQQMPYLGAPFEPRDSGFQTPSTPYMDARTRLSPDITSTGPYQGIAGEKLTINFRSQSEYSPQKFFFLIHFSYRSCKAALSKSFYQEPYHHYTLTVDVPNVDTDSSTMPLLLEIQDENALTLEHKNLGNFIYTSQAGYQPYSSVERKRKFSEDSSDFLQSTSSKRSASQPLQSRYKDSSPMYTTGQGHLPTGVQYSPLFSMPSYDRPAQQEQRSYGQPLAQRPAYGYSMSPSMIPQAMKNRSLSVANYGSYSAMAHPGHSPRNSTAPMSRSVSATSSANPPLIRTTILKPPPPVPQPSYGATTSHSFNPYAIYPNAKAVLNIVGDMRSMCENWTPEEKLAKRRLVEFQRSQSGSTITTSFRPVSQEERSPNNPCISCILWEKKGQCFVTSVDTIALLEALVAVRFTVEEKNRIRRNLEGFKPYTVSKAKEECDDIFRLIMGFPNPKPRNIEKDIKIFPWSILSSALKKIISKYSASYASTSSILTPSTSAYGSTLSEAQERHHPTASPCSTASSTVSNPYQSNMTSTALSPSLVAGSAGLGVHELRSSIPQLVTGGAPLGQWQTQYPGHYATGMAAAAAAPLAGRASWDMAAYLEQGSASGSAPGTGASEQHLAYYRSVSDRAAEQTADPTVHHSTYTSQGHQQTSRT